MSLTREDIEAFGFRRMEAHHYLENPLRAYLVIAVRTDHGDFFGVPMFYAVPADMELYREAEREAVSRYRQKISRVTGS
jgi:hypothetical protein